MIVLGTVVLVVGALLAGIGFGLTQRAQPGTTTYLTVLGALGMLSLLLVTPRTGVVDAQQALELLFAGWMLTSALWALFAFTYTGRGPAITRLRSIGLFGVALVTMIAILTLEMIGITSALLALILAPLLIVVLSLAVFGVFLVARAGLVDDDLPLHQSVLLTGAGTGVILLFPTSNIDVLLGPERATIATLATLATTAGLLMTAQFGYNLLQTGPSAGYLAREVILDEMADSVLLVDRQSRLLDANQTADETFQLTRENALGTHLSDVFDIPLDGDGSVVTLETRTGRREFELSRSKLTNSASEHVGQSIILRDVTGRRTHEQRLSVLNRVLRHNLRNDLDAIRSFAEVIEEEPSATEPMDYDARIQKTATELFELGEMVARTERLLTRQELTYEPIEIPAFAAELRAQFDDQYPHCEILLTTPHPLTVRTDRTLLAAALQELLRNACEHNDNESPTVEMAINRTPDGVRIAIEDNGPGIPAQERTVLLEGEETPLRHGSGLGLWVVYWAVTRIGGELSFNENTPHGSVVTIELVSQRREG